MVYELPKTIQNESPPSWNEGIGSIPAELPDGNHIDFPIYKNVNYLTFGVTGAGKTSSFTEPAAKILLDSDAYMQAVFFEVKRSFID